MIFCHQILSNIVVLEDYNGNNVSQDLLEIMKITYKSFIESPLRYMKFNPYATKVNEIPYLYIYCAVML